MTLDEIMILTDAGISVDVETESALMPDGKLLAVRIQDEVEVRLFSPEGNQHPYVFRPGEWFEIGEDD